jgi:hypothetical protein
MSAGLEVDQSLPVYSNKLTLRGRALVFVNQAGERQAVRYQMLPENVVHLDKSDAAKRTPDFLMEELPERLKDCRYGHQKGKTTHDFLTE